MMTENDKTSKRDAQGGDAGGIVPTAEQKRRQRSRSIAIATVLGALCLLFYVVTIVKLGPGVLVRPL